MFGAIMGAAGLVAGLAEGASHNLSSIQDNELSDLQNDVAYANQQIQQAQSAIQNKEAAYENEVQNLDQDFGSTYGHFILQNFDLPSINKAENSYVSKLQSRINQAESEISSFNAQESYIKEHPQGGGLLGILGRVVNTL